MKGYNMKIRRNFIAGTLAILAMLGFLAVIGFLAYEEIPAANENFFNTVLIALISFVSTAFGYFLGAAERDNDIKPMETTNE